MYQFPLSDPKVSKRQVLFIDHFINACAKHEALFLMDDFSRYNQIQIHHVKQHKTTFTTPWGTFSYHNMPFGLKNTGSTF
jgi:hypothetical protein